jgi:hypothetical protein
MVGAAMLVMVASQQIQQIRDQDNTEDGPHQLG